MLGYNCFIIFQYYYPKKYENLEILWKQKSYENLEL